MSSLNQSLSLPARDTVYVVQSRSFAFTERDVVKLKLKYELKHSAENSQRSMFTSQLIISSLPKGIQSDINITTCYAN